jgi:hypothetical protein
MRWWLTVAWLPAVGCGETENTAGGVCDGNDDCAGAEDERADQCDSVPTGFICSGSTRVPRREVCDGKPDCDNAADEANCPGILCFDGERLLPRTKKCDGVSDCADGSDESECTARPKPPPFA